MANLQDLPVEILKHVLSFFIARRDPLWETWESGIENNNSKEEDDLDDDEDETLEPLYNMCLVSKKLRDVAQPLLFLNFADDGVMDNMEETIRFARCLYRNPELGKHVQELSIYAPIPLDESEPEEEPAWNELTEEDIELLGTEHKAWIPALKECDLSVLAALITKKTPNLRRLILPGGLFRMENFSELIPQNPEFLRKLERVAFVSNDESTCYDIASYHEFLTLPSMKFSFFEHGDLQSKTFPSTWEPQTLTVEDLSFRDCQIDASSFKRLARACKKLKTVLFDDFATEALIPRDRATYTGSQFNAADAHEALLGHKDTLKYLRLDFPRSESDLNNWQRFLSSRVKMGPLSDFPVLEHIHLQQAIVPVQPKFSPAVKRLVISDCNSSVINLVKNIAKDCKKGLYPDLVHFSMVAVDLTAPIQLPGQVIPEGKTPYDAHQDLVNLFDGTGVDFCIRPFKRPSVDELMGGLGLDDDDDDFGFGDDDLAYDSEGYEIDDPLGDAFRAARAGEMGGGGRNGPMPQGLLEHFMRRAMQDPDFAPLHPSTRGSRRPQRPQRESQADVWETDESD